MTDTRRIQINFELADNIFEETGIRVYNSVQGANIIPDEQCFNFGKRNSDDEVCEIIFEIDDNLHLSNFIDRMPYGIVNKKATGIGATYLEITCPRNSIIVMPTKLLAYKKFLKHENTFYVGSEIGTITTPIAHEDIQRYVNNPNIEFKKILVVADSLKKVISAIGNSIYQDYFIMIDEIDVMQSDGDYRKPLEIAMDYYFKYTREKRCVVSATIREFCHPELKNESIVTIVKKNPLQRDIKLKHAINGNVHGLLVNQIKEISTNFPNDKIVIAYSSVIAIMQIIQMLGEELQNQCGVYCSANKKEDVDPYYRMLSEEILSDRISFTTSVFFVGIDIEERFHLITVCDSDKKHTQISINKMTQIHGRCRNNLGLFSDTIIFDTNSDTLVNDKTIEEYEIYLIEKAQFITGFNEKITELRNSGYINNQDTATSNLMKSLMKNLVGLSEDNNVSIIRENYLGNLDVAYFNIDNLIEKQEISESGIYQQSLSLKTELEKFNHTVHLQDINIAFSNEQEMIENESLGALAETKTRMAIQAAEKIENLVIENNINSITINNLIGSNTTNAHERKFIKRFKDLNQYVPTEQLLKILISVSNQTSRPYNNLHNMILFWALECNHPFKVAIRTLFKLGNGYTKNEIYSNLEPIMRIYFNKSISRDKEPASILGFMFKITSSKITINGQAVDGYRIRSLVPEKINILENLEPKISISQHTTNLSNIFQL